MTTSLRSVGLLAAACALWTQTAGAQTTPTSSQASSSQSSSDATASRPATTTFYGDTGLWFVPTAEILPHGKVSASGYRRGTNYVQGFTNVGDIAGTFGVGLKD